MREIVGPVIDQHVAELAILRNTRSSLIASGSVALRHIARLDRRIAAHIDGCVVAGREGVELLLAGLADPTPAALFAAAVVALESQDASTLDHCVTVGETIPETVSGLTSALGWVERERLAKIAVGFLQSSAPFRRRLGLASCRLHGVHPGDPLKRGLADSDATVRAEAIRTAGTIGARELRAECVGALDDDDPDCQFWAASSGVLLGDRDAALEQLTNAAATPGSHRDRAFPMAIQAMSLDAANAFLRNLTSDPNDLRCLIQGAGISGDPKYVPWLIDRMADDKTSRIAGEAFSLITGADLAWLDLQRKPPENVESGPNDNPDDENVEMDPDDGLPWPEPERIQAWWGKHASRMPAGARSFMGAPVTRERCLEVLRSGYQRQRRLGARYLCLLKSGTALFNTSAPAWRQQRELERGQ